MNKTKGGIQTTSNFETEIKTKEQTNINYTKTNKSYNRL